MKKISLFALALTTSVAMFAQNHEMTTKMATKPYFGVKAGVNLAEFRVHDSPIHYGTNNKTSMNGGFLLNLPLSGNFSVQPELIYNGYGSKLNANIAGQNMAYEQDLGYISLPIMFQARSTGGFIVEVGPQPSYLVRAQSQQGSNKVNNRDDFDKFDIAVAGGIGYLSRVGLGINARYNLGLSNTIDDGGGNNSPNNGTEFKNQAISIGLSYLFGAAK